MDKFIVLVGKRRIVSCDDFYINRQENSVELYWNGTSRKATIAVRREESVVVKLLSGAVVVSVHKL